MDVVCERCKAEYEFDDALVSERGTTVKCTTCGHQFKIYRPAVGEGGRSWHLRRPDGTVIPFDSLAVLQKWILEGRVSKVDEISRPGEPWKPLGAIAELESFFVTGEMRAAPKPAIPSNRPPPPPLATPSLRPPTPPRGAPAALPRAPHSVRPPPPPGASAQRTHPGDLHERTATSGTPVLPPPPRLPTDAPRAAVSTVEGYALGDAAIGPPKVPPTSPVVSMPPPSLPSTPAPTLDRPPAPMVDDDTSLPPVVPASGGSRGMFIGLALGLAVTIALGGAAWQLGYLHPAATTTAPTPAAANATEVTARLDAARRLAVRHTPRALEDAREELTRALALAPDDAATLAGRAQVMALWGELLRQRADDLDARARGATSADASAVAPESAALRRDANERIERARADLPRAEAGVSSLRGEARAQAEAALADVARIAGDTAAAQRHLEAARIVGGGVDADLAAALIARDTGLASAAAEGLRAVVGRAADRAQARLALARVLAAQGDAAGARRELDAVLLSYADHDDARALLAALEHNEAPMRGAVAANTPTPNAPTPNTPTPPTPPTPSAPAPNEPSTASTNTARRSDAPPTSGRSYDQLIEDGERLLRDRMEVTQARERFRAALAQRPDGCEALVGLGDVELEGGNLSTAVSQYRRALSLCPRAGDAWVGLGQAYTSMQNYDQAITAYTRYLDVNPGGGHANMARRHIEQLRERIAASGASPTTPTPGH
jgi:predicted Zn finger-like uncharacterized protein